MVSEIKTGMALFLALLLNSGLLFIDAYVVYESVRNDFSVGLNYRLPDYVIPKSYDVQLMIPNKVSYANSLDFSGKINITIQVLQPTQNISLHAHPYIKIHNSLMKDNIMNVYEPMKYEYCNKTHILTLYFNSTLLQGDYILHMKFENSLYNDGFYKEFYYINEEKNVKGWLIVSRFKAIGTRRIFPCWDEPKLKAIFNISLYHHESLTSETNMPLKKLLLDENNMIWAIFHMTPEIPPYLVAVMISAYYGSSYEKRIANIWCREFLAKHLDFALDIADKVRMYFRYLLEFSTLIAEPKVKHVAIPGYQDDNMENWRLLFYRETDILYDEYIEPIARKTEIAYLVARKIAHQWFGNLVSPSWWSYLWLNDGIATLLAIDAIDKTLLNSHMLDLFVVQVQHESLHLDSDLIIEPLISEINNPSEINSLSFSRYIKAPAILRMLKHTLTIDVFQEGLDIYLRNHIFKSATLDDFWTAMQTALDESSFKEYRFNVSQRMANWIKDPSYPVINVTQSSPKHVTVSLAKSSKVKSRWIPVSITTQSESNFDQTFFAHGQWIGLRNLTYCTFFLPYEENGWIIANLKQAGYYRVNYDSKNWQKIADFLDSPNYSEIDVLNRAQIIDDAFHLMITKQLCPTTFWKLASYLSQEKEYIAWYPMIKALERMSHIFSLPEKRTKRIKKIMHILDDLLTEIKYDDNPDDSDHLKSLREEIAKWACILGVRECKDKAQQKMEKYLTDPEKYEILPPWKEWTFCNGMKRASEKIWTNVLYEWQETHDNIILKSLTCFENYHTIRTILSTLRMKRGPLDLDLKDRINIYSFIIAKHIRKNEILEDILNNFQEFKPRKFRTIAALIYIINHVNSEEQLDKISTFVSNNLGKLNIKQLNSDIQRKIETRQSQIKNQINYLHKLQIPNSKLNGMH